jgi:hypothetical protein
MADEFPALEAAAALGMLALSVRAFLLAREAPAIRRDNEKLVEALRAGAHARAVELCASAESPLYAELARTILAVVEDRAQELDAKSFARQLAHAAHGAVSRARRRLQTGRARDLVLLAVLIGALAYGLGGGLGASVWFLPLIAATCAVLVAGFALRGRVARELSSSTATLLSAAATARATAPDALSDGPCPSCGESEQIVLRDPDALGPAPWGLGVVSLRICRTCGELHGKVKDPSRIPIGPAHGTILAVTRDPGDLAVTAGPREHEG